jgi:hypothetical protein
MASSQTARMTSLTLPPTCSATHLASDSGRSKIAKLLDGDCRRASAASRGELKGSARASRRSPAICRMTSTSRRTTPTMVCSCTRSGFRGSRRFGEIAWRAGREAAGRGAQIGLIVR